jgi:hypothetical protein
VPGSSAAVKVKATLFRVVVGAVRVILRFLAQPPPKLLKNNVIVSSEILVKSIIRNKTLNSVETDDG